MLLCGARFNQSRATYEDRGRRAIGGKDPNLVIAALLHDAIEDQASAGPALPASLATMLPPLLKRRPRQVIAEGCTQRLQVEHAPISRRAKILKLADKISNVTAIGKDPPPDWPIDHQREYVQWGRDVVRGLRGASPELETLFDRTADEAEHLIEGRRA